MKLRLVAVLLVALLLEKFNQSLVRIAGLLSKKMKVSARIVKAD
jgi:hypothetical protein